MPPDGFNGERETLGGPLSILSGSALALLVVKPPNSTGPLRISQAPTMISDIPATSSDTMGLKNPFPGISAMKLDEHAAAAAHVRRLSVEQRRLEGRSLSVHGRVHDQRVGLDGSAWKTEDPIYLPGMDIGERSRGFYPPERGGTGITFRWTGPMPTFTRLASAKGLELTVRSAAPTPQTLTVEMRGTVDRHTSSRAITNGNHHLPDSRRRPRTPSPMPSGSS